MEGVRKYGLQLVWLLMISCQATDIAQLIAIPSTNVHKTSGSLTLRCVLQQADETNAESEGLSNRRMDHVTAIVVERIVDDERFVVGHISLYEEGTAKVDLDKLQVVGNLTSDTVFLHPFLELTWTNPGHEQAGDYTCTISGIDRDGRGLSVASLISVYPDSSPDEEDDIEDADVIVDGTAPASSALDVSVLTPQKEATKLRRAETPELQFEQSKLVSPHYSKSTMENMNIVSKQETVSSFEEILERLRLLAIENQEVLGELSDIINSF